MRRKAASATSVTGPVYRYVVDLAISADEFQRLYAGTANTVIARDRISGKTVRFPASRLRRFVTPAGVFGRFELQVDGANRLQHIQIEETHR